MLKLRDLCVPSKLGPATLMIKSAKQKTSTVEIDCDGEMVSGEDSQLEAVRIVI